MSELHSGTGSKTKAGALFFLCNFVPCDWVVRRAYFRLLSIEKKIKHVKTEVSLVRGRIKSIQSYFDAEKSFVDLL